MNTITPGKAWQWLISPPKPEQRFLGIIAWWEIRRLVYNAILLVFGGICLVLFIVFIERTGALRAPGEDAVEPLALLAAPFLINFLYTSGWIAHILLQLAGAKTPRLGPNMWLIGTAFSLLVVSLPAVMWGVILAIDGPVTYRVERAALVGTYAANYSYNRPAEKLILNADGSYEQVLQPTRGNTVKNTGAWSTSQDSDGHTQVDLENRMAAFDRDYRGRPLTHPEYANAPLSAQKTGSEVYILDYMSDDFIEYRKLK